MIGFIAAIDSVKFSSKSELSSRFFGRLKFVSGAKIYGREIHGGPARMAGWAGGPGHVTPMIIDSFHYYTLYGDEKLI